MGRPVLTDSRVALVCQDFQDWKVTKEWLATTDFRVWMDSMEHLVEKAPLATEDRQVCLVRLESRALVALKETKEKEAFMAHRVSQERTGSTDSKVIRVNLEITSRAKTAHEDYEETKEYKAYLAVMDLW